MLDNIARRIYRKLPLSNTKKEKLKKIYNKIFDKKSRNNKKNVFLGEKASTKEKDYINQILSIPLKDNTNYVEITKENYKRKDKDVKIIAYYLPQYYPFKENDEWWGKGTTEWTNVTKAVPQYVGHYQPRLPGELGFYDLRLVDNIKRQIELASMYGIYGFCYYYYWFNGKRLLDKPLDIFIENKNLDFPFCLCWANENWTRRFDGTNEDVIMEQPTDVESYKNVIEDIAKYLKDERYISINNKKLLIIYRPSLVPNPSDVLYHWREYCRNNGLGELHIMGIKENNVNINLLEQGYDSIGEFHPGTLYQYCKFITDKIDYIRDDFSGIVIDYEDIVKNKRYFEYSYPKLYRSIMPMWDNTARRNNKAMIFENASPSLYKEWLKDIIQETVNNDNLEDNIIFVNAWNEWAEGAYLEPDRKYGYAYLQATKEAIEESRE